MPSHELVERLEAVWIAWRFSDRGTALEGSLAVYFQRVQAEVDRRRRRALTGSCTCLVCCSLRDDVQLF